MELDEKTTKQLQNRILKMFLEFKKICEDNCLKYYLIGGSCLGVVRHKGFIPWDDIDVGMPREDFTTFCQIAPKYLSQNLFLQTYESDQEYYLGFAKIRDSNTTYIESGVAQLNINHGI
ncbi:MAG: LicD family protein [Oscillospiraceae bacterium]|nr:LicD family protein [Oscillospiraceae bacterium]